MNSREVTPYDYDKQNTPKIFNADDISKFQTKAQ